AYKLNSTTAAGALAAAALLGAGGHWAHARAADPGAVNSPAAIAPARAPASFADIVERVAPAVVSIDVEGTGGPRRVAFDGQGEGPSPFGPDASPFDFDLRRFFPQM